MRQHTSLNRLAILLFENIYYAKNAASGYMYIRTEHAMQLLACELLLNAVYTGLIPVLLLFIIETHSKAIFCIWTIYPCGN